MDHIMLKLSGLIGSRICHDLSNPIGAIGNGIELLNLQQQVQGGEEKALIAQSHKSAEARLRLFRIAFGQNSPAQQISGAEARAILTGAYEDSPVQIDWQVSQDHPRAEVKATFLAVLCLISALPFGGTVSVTRPGGDWVLHATSERLKWHADSWAFDLDKALDATTANGVHFPLFFLTLLDLEQELTVERSRTTISLRF